MFSSNANITAALSDFHIEGMMMRYSVFVPRLYNFCKTLGFESGRIMPSRAFCSDENQGYPVILIAKHFGTFPFNHGRVGGIVATDRHGPHAEHGQDLVIIQASHVGYDPDTGAFGTYRRIQIEDNQPTPTCGKIANVLGWYQNEYEFACENIRLGRLQGRSVITIDNQLMNPQREEGLKLNLDRLIAFDGEECCAPLRTYSTSRSYPAAQVLIDALPESVWQDGAGAAIGTRLSPELFFFSRHISPDNEGQDHMSLNLLGAMPWIVTSKAPLLTAAQVNTQAEFDRTFRTITKEHQYRGRRMVFISGLHIDISPQQEQRFPLTKYVPWAAYVQNPDGSHYTLEQNELMAVLKEQPEENPDQIDLEEAIQVMGRAKEVKVML